MFEQAINAILPLNFLYGAALAALTLLPLNVWWLFIPEATLSAHETWLDRHLPKLIGALLAVTASLALTYLAFPSYLDHVEATSAMLGKVLHEGGAIWPDLNFDHSYRGLLYGPGLAEVQWLAMHLPLNPVLSSKLPGVLAFLLALFLVHRKLRHTAAKAYLLLILPFGLLLFWTRAEPLFLLLLALTLALNQQAMPPPMRALLVGLLMGAACTLKMHAGIYVLAAYLCVPSPRKIHELALVALAGIGLFGLAFLPQSMSLASFFAYLQLASHHGLAAKMALKNGLMLALILLPMAFALVQREVPKLWRMATWVFIAATSLVAVIGAKPGAGAHHMLPLIPLGAYLIDNVLDANDSANSFRRSSHLVGLSYLLPSIVTLTLLSNNMMMNWQDLARARDEVQAIGKRAPNAVMGLPGWRSYHYTFLKVWLPAPASTQVDFASYMDLQFAGVSDQQLQQALADCRIPHIVMPKGEQPFSMGNYYDTQPLMSDALRTTFLTHYKEVEAGKLYVLWRCTAH